MVANVLFRARERPGPQRKRVSQAGFSRVCESMLTYRLIQKLRHSKVLLQGSRELRSKAKQKPPPISRHPIHDEAVEGMLQTNRVANFTLFSMPALEFYVAPLTIDRATVEDLLDSILRDPSSVKVESIHRLSQMKEVVYRHPPVRSG